MSTVGMISDVTAPFDASFASYSSIVDELEDNDQEHSLAFSEDSLLGPDNADEFDAIATLREQLQVAAEERSAEALNHDRMVAELQATIHELHEQLALARSAPPPQGDPKEEIVRTNPDPSESSVVLHCKRELELLQFERTVLQNLLSGLDAMNPTDIA
jgi:hypothetical protein